NWVMISELTSAAELPFHPVPADRIVPHRAHRAASGGIARHRDVIMSRRAEGTVFVSNDFVETFGGWQRINARRPAPRGKREGLYSGRAGRRTLSSHRLSVCVSDLGGDMSLRPLHDGYNLGGIRFRSCARSA